MEAVATGKDDKKPKEKAPAKGNVAAAVEGPSDGTLLVDSTQFKYLVDIYNEATNTGKYSYYFLSYVRFASQINL